MSGTSEKLSRQIASTQDIASVVRSMKALAASSITQYEQAVLSLSDYHRSLELAMSVCLKRAALSQEPAPSSRSPVVGAIVFGSDQGLVGRFNDVLWEFAGEKLATLAGTIGLIWTIGDRMQQLANDSHTGSSSSRPGPGSPGAITSFIDGLAIDLGAMLASGQVAEIYVFHNRPQAPASYAPVHEKLLPLDEKWQHRVAALPWVNRCLPDVLGDANEALQRFTKEYLFVLLFRACAESLASENASRLAAMQRAERNIDELRTQLTRRFQRTRQESIDEELFDVVSGYESLADALGHAT